MKNKVLATGSWTHTGAAWSLKMEVRMEGITRATSRMMAIIGGGKEEGRKGGRKVTK
jgi:hypothetical protein